MTTQMPLIVMRYLCTNSEYAQRVLPFLKPAYFDDPVERATFTCIASFINQYHNLPSSDAVELLLNKTTLVDDDMARARTLVKTVYEPQSNSVTLEWLTNETEAWVQERDLYVTLYDCMERIEVDKQKGTTKRHEIPAILSNSLSLSFDT